MNDGLKVLITGASGMVGEGVLLECLQHPSVAEILVITRRTTGIQHPKLTEIIHKDFFNLFSLRDQLKGIDACYFCLGISSVGISADAYYRTTYTLTMHMAELLVQASPQAVFCYVSGAGTDSSEHGRIRWARVKGQTENHLMKLPFKAVYAFRPAFMKPSPGQKNVKSIYKFISWLYPIGRKLSPNSYCTLREVGLAMINITLHGYSKKVITGRDIIALAAK
ncbi:NAD-dependent epimerase/dehydratase family protein [Pseudobacter ginsenosidimutans]|uniref:NAD-dependent epimerase/dehydratase family protein n=1 Tax=Pseudobacter ginsenosidimutans TaxID=661488 RepID=A0A4Q7MLQ9_9BACT|nr:NAD-dependent epimerase/dehydratase family protein [Pseudobacter ginsenosidimutans]QEC45741.1 NAD-dependent epimerase/dehydratase family protein [Pseudobacter ginsenosidimutans]RZS69315.1 NAD-dependent epimerase/dehydratase family protein [Pseudobacter ginsenosidimutans]